LFSFPLMGSFPFFPIGVFLAVMAFAAPAHAAPEAGGQANRLFVEAVQLTRKADNTYDAKESVRLLRSADQILKKIIANYPQSDIAVRLSTHQLIGDFDIFEFEARIRALSCARGSYVEDFLADYGIATGTGPLTEACFLYRMENLLLPADSPVTQARADWLSVAVGYYLSGQEERARGIILPYMGLLRKSGAGSAAPDSYLMLAKALAVTGANEQAQQVVDYISDCSNRLSYMMTTLNSALGKSAEDEAKTLASQIKTYAENNGCEWQMGLVAQALALTGRDQDAKAAYDKIVARRSEDTFSSGQPQGLAVAASMLDDPSQALSLARSVMESDPEAVPVVVMNLARRGEYSAAHDFATGSSDSSRKASLLAAAIAGAVMRNDGKIAETWMHEIQSMRNDAAQAAEQAQALAAIAYAEKVFYKDERWRNTFQLALNAAERADDNGRGPLMTSLASFLLQIKAGRALLD
jgi:hypothetical protein